MRINIHKVYRHNASFAVDMFAEVSGLPRVESVPANQADAAGEKLYEETIELMRHEVEKWDELKRRNRHDARRKVLDAGLCAVGAPVHLVGVHRRCDGAGATGQEET